MTAIVGQIPGSVVDHRRGELVLRGDGLAERRRSASRLRVRDLGQIAPGIDPSAFVDDVPILSSPKTCTLSFKDGVNDSVCVGSRRHRDCDQIAILLKEHIKVQELVYQLVFLLRVVEEDSVDAISTASDNALELQAVRWILLGTDCVSISDVAKLERHARHNT